MNEIYRLAKEFKKKYPRTIGWRLKAHSKVAQKYLNPGEEVRYVFFGQKNHFSYEIMFTNLIVITNQRVILTQKRLLFGHFYVSVTPDMYNDLTIKTGLLWGKVVIDTVKEVIQVSNIDSSALPEIETQITSFMIEAKQRYGLRDSGQNA